MPRYRDGGDSLCSCLHGVYSLGRVTGIKELKNTVDISFQL